ncbi:Zinc finger, RING-type [Dillenia turbinata]|uniref:Zinc finger, RING-type n=1 Tax=Dillenia turbinata TaxID=194707 RepID=A0AAN8VPU1_9MAGN
MSETWYPQFSDFDHETWHLQFSRFDHELFLSSTLPSPPQSPTLIQLKFLCHKKYMLYSVSEDQICEFIKEIGGGFYAPQDLEIEESNFANPDLLRSSINHKLAYFTLQSDFLDIISNDVITKVGEIISELQDKSESQLINLYIKITDYSYYFRNEDEYRYYMRFRSLEEEEEDEEEDEDEEDDGMIPTKEASIEALETKVYDSKENESCTICFEDFLEGEQMKLMPCSHFYHGECIKKWLKRSHFCPICRYEMPAENLDDPEI